MKGFIIPIWLITALSTATTVFAYGPTAAAERLYYWFAYQADGILGEKSGKYRIAPGCVGSSGDRCELEEFLVYIWKETTGDTIRPEEITTPFVKPGQPIANEKTNNMKAVFDNILRYQDPAQIAAFQENVRQRRAQVALKRSDSALTLPARPPRSLLNGVDFEGRLLQGMDKRTYNDVFPQLAIVFKELDQAMQDANHPRAKEGRRTLDLGKVALDAVYDRRLEELERARQPELEAEVDQLDSSGNSSDSLAYDDGDDAGGMTPKLGKKPNGALNLAESSKKLATARGWDVDTARSKLEGVLDNWLKKSGPGKVHLRVLTTIGAARKTLVCG